MSYSEFHARILTQTHTQNRISQNQQQKLKNKIK